MKFTNAAVLILTAVIAALFSGCSSTQKRAMTTTAGGAFAGLAGYALAEGKDAKTRAAIAAGSAVVGAGVTALAQGDDPEVFQEGVDRGYELGTGDAIKRQYWLKQALEKKAGENAEASDSVRTTYYTFQGATETKDGRKLVPEDVTVPVVERTP